MSELMNKQKQLQRSIERFLENFKKMGRNNHTPSTIKSRMKSLTSFWTQFQDGHCALESALSLPNRDSLEYFTENQFEKTEDVYLSTLDYLTEVLDAAEPGTSQPAVKSSSYMRTTSGVSSAHLPVIELPQFDGKYEEWEHFRDRFTTLIIKNSELSNFARMHFLISALKGTALECVRGLSVTEENFEIAWKALIVRFENKRRLLSRHLATLFNLSTVARESARDLQALLDRGNIAVASLISLNRSPEELWNDVLVHLVTQKLDPATRKAWNMRASDDDKPASFNDLTNFVTSRVRALEETNENKNSATQGSSNRSNVPRINSAPAIAVPQTKCSLCPAKHYINECAKFLSRNPTQRKEIIKRTNRCFNCLSRTHSIKECKSKFTCRVCNKKHHTLLHSELDSSSKNASEVSVSNSPTPDVQINDEIHAACTSINSKSRPRVLLATARVTVTVASGRSIVVRALVDPGSEMTLLSEKIAQMLRVRRIHMPTEVSAVAGLNAGVYNHATKITISPSERTTPAFATVALILKTLTSYVPKLHGKDKLNHVADLPWADRDPTSRDPIDLIIGSDLYNDLILDGFRRGESGLPSAQNTALGWIISGPVSYSITAAFVATSNLSSENPNERIPTSASLDFELRKFWEIEEIPRARVCSPEDEQCEQHFVETHSRLENGRYVVRLPFKQGPPISIGESYIRAEKLLNSTYRRFQAHAAMFREYSEFLHEYEQSGHMTEVTKSLKRNTNIVYLPHHPVVRESSITTHLRVVFNASSLTTNGTSLNDHLLSGPKLQTDLNAVILRWRKYRYVFSADIKQMYRQILVDERDLDYQRILWKTSPIEPIREYQLRTVTYGMSAAPFLALRVIKQLINDEGARYPMAESVLRENIYVDDVLFGDHDIPSIKAKREQVCSLLSCGGFELRKWASNSAELLERIKSEYHGSTGHKLIQSDERFKILGLMWDPIADSFRFQVNTSGPLPRTKRTILSTIAKLFDPLGLVTPVIISAKIFMQQLWLMKLEWDSNLPDKALRPWQDIYSTLSELNGLSISRWTGHTDDLARVELHGFSDASQSAYAAAVYLRIIDQSENVQVTLLAGKSKVAPVTPMSIPRLELSAAVLLARLVRFVRDSLSLQIDSCVCWTDSTVVLAWLNKHPSNWKTFISNRLVEVHSCIPEASWHHVLSEENPADCASRGLLAAELVSHSLWWRGPNWLSHSAVKWPAPDANAKLQFDTQLETRRVTTHLIRQTDSWDLSTRYSSWSKLIIVTAYILKFIRNCRSERTNAQEKTSGSIALTANEFQDAKTFWFKQIQSELFPKEIKSLTTNKSIDSKSALLCLNPFLDKNGLLRVGGRLKEASLPFEQKHPKILASHHLVSRFIFDTHTRMLHAGPQLTLATLRQEAWILRSRSVIKNILHRCVRCARERAAVPTQLMSNLPAARVSRTTRCFIHCGLDYAGPVNIKSSSRRGSKSEKAYIALFVCLATRAVHIELVGSYSARAFLDAFSRFCARRGLPQVMHSDNGTNFVGADRELTTAYKAAIRDPEFLNKTASDNITWRFIPPSAPHFGGLWEAGIRSLKCHVRRVLGNHTLTFEEFTTLLCRVEACLNSRPLSPLPSSSDDCDFLTPGHFLLGANPSVPPEPSVLNLNENRLSRWQLIRQLTERIWKLWQNDYLHTLQQRVKWRKQQPPFRTGQLILLRNNTLPPCKWELGRVMRCHPGPDGLIRVVTVRTAKSELTRPIVKLCLLPIDIEENQNSRAATN